MTKQKITYQRMLSFALAFLLLFISIITLFPVTSNAASSHSNVMEDLKSDKSFDASKYPSKSNDVTVGVIHIAESTSGELYIYTYAPGNATAHRKANYINMSLQAPTPENTDSLQYKTYSLTWLSNKDLFDGVAAISGSFWYDGFAEWIEKQDKFSCVRFHISMGEREKETKVKRFANIEEDTMKVVETLMAKGADVTFEITEGGHNSPVIPRFEKSVASLLGNQ